LGCFGRLVLRRPLSGATQWDVIALRMPALGAGLVVTGVGRWPILLKNPVSADGRKNLALIGREARFDVEEYKELLHIARWRLVVLSRNVI